MRFLFVSKAPPLQGGASLCAAETAQVLVRAGHVVELLSDANEVEPVMRTYGGRLVAQRGYRPLQPQPIGQFEHFPISTLRTERLLGAGLRRAREVTYDGVIGWYLLPYGSVASQLAAALDVPLILVHGGSDIHTLSRHPDLREAVANTLRGARAVLTASSKTLVSKLASLGAPAGAIEQLESAFPLPPFHYEPAGISFEEVVSAVREDVAESFSSDPELRDAFLAVSEHKELPRPVFIQYGKVSAAKRSEEAIRDLARLASDGEQFGFIGLCCGRRESVLRTLRALAASPLARQAIVLPAIDPALVPVALREADIGLCLEDGFGVPSHLSVMPREMWNAGLAVVMSLSLTRQPFFRWVAQPDLNVRVCGNGRIYPVCTELLGNPLAVKQLRAGALVTSRVLECEIGTINPVAQRIETVCGAPPRRTHGPANAARHG